MEDNPGPEMVEEDAIQRMNSWPFSFAEDQSKHRSHHAMSRLSANRLEQEQLKDRVRVSVSNWDSLKSQFESNRGRGRARSKHEEPHAQGVFLDVDSMKSKVRESLQLRDYNVANYYHDSGIWQYIAKNQVFEQITLGVIGVNAIWIAVDTDYNKADILLDAEAPFVVMENCFCFYFFIELLVRFMSFRAKRDALKDAWFVFDAVLVLMMVLETWVLCLVMALSQQNVSGGMGNASVLRIARLLRLTRMARMARLLRVMPELMIMIKGMIAAMRSVFFTLLLQIVIMYVFGIAFTQMLEETDVGSRHFSSVPESMYTLLMYGTFLDEIGTLVARMGRESPLVAGFFLIFVLMAALTVMNMLIGVLCEVVSAVAATEKETMLVSWVRSKIATVVQELDTNGDNCISRTEFIKILENGNACRALRDVGVDVVGLVDLTDTIFDAPQANDQKELSFADFMDVILQLRGTNNATVKDIVDLRKLVNQMHAQTQQYVENLVGCMSRQATQSVEAVESTEKIEKSVHIPAHSQGETALLESAASLPYEEFVREASKYKFCSEQSMQAVTEKSINSDAVQSSWQHCHTSATNSVLESTSASNSALESTPLKSDVDFPIEDEGCPQPIQLALSTELLAAGWEELPSDPPDASKGHPKGNGLTVHTSVGNPCLEASREADGQIWDLRTPTAGEKSFSMQTQHTNSEPDTLLQARGGFGNNQDGHLQDLHSRMSRLGEALSIGMCEFEKIQQNFTQNVNASAQDFSWRSNGTRKKSSSL